MNKTSPQISIILPIYNGEEYLSYSIQSILNQTYQDWELIIVNDCSTDQTSNIIKQFSMKDSRIKVITNKNNQKLPKSLNIGFSQARGKYLPWTSDDNEYDPAALEKMYNFLEENNDVGMVYANCLVVSENKENTFWGNKDATPENLLMTNVCGACFLYRKSVAETIGEYNCNLFLAEDHDYWLRIRLKYKIERIPEELYLYRQHSKNLTNTRKKEAFYKDVELTSLYREIYLETFPYLDLKVQKYIALREQLKNKRDILLKEMLEVFSKREIYREIKYFQSIDSSNFYLKQIRKLGGIYLFKSFLLYFKSKGK
jgi:glycosyltransferase involved in cell wall biosynthesis